MGQVFWSKCMYIGLYEEEKTICIHGLGEVVQKRWSNPQNFHLRRYMNGLSLLKICKLVDLTLKSWYMGRWLPQFRHVYQLKYHVPSLWAKPSIGDYGSGGLAISTIGQGTRTAGKSNNFGAGVDHWQSPPPHTWWVVFNLFLPKCIQNSKFCPIYAKFSACGAIKNLFIARGKAF